MRVKDRYLSVPAAAAMCGMSPRQFGRLLDDGVMPYLQAHETAHRRVRESDVLRFRDNITYQGCHALADGLPDLLKD